VQLTLNPKVGAAQLNHWLLAWRAAFDEVMIIGKASDRSCAICGNAHGDDRCKPNNDY
jgi:hypothetical protein